MSSQDSKISQWFGWLLAHQLDKTLESSVAPSTLFAPYYSYYFYYFYYFDSFHSTLLSKIPRQNKEKEKSSLQVKRRAVKRRASTYGEHELAVFPRSTGGWHCEVARTRRRRGLGAHASAAPAALEWARRAFRQY